MEEEQLPTVLTRLGDIVGPARTIDLVGAIQSPGPDAVEERVFDEERAIVSITRLMRVKFSARRDSKPRWVDMTLAHALTMIDIELRELNTGVDEYIANPTRERRLAVLYECGDVANMVAILADLPRDRRV